jgi:hypothetical protein
VLKMAEKRAQTAAVLRLPGASEVFAEPSPVNEEEEDEGAAEKKELLTLIGKWWRSLPAGSKGKACNVVFGTHDPKALPILALEALDDGYAVIERAAEAQVNWKSATLAADLEKLTTQSATKATSDLFGDQGTVQATQQAAREGKPPAPIVDTMTGEILGEPEEGHASFTYNDADAEENARLDAEIAAADQARAAQEG